MSEQEKDDTWGLYYKTFYGSNCCRIIIRQCFCHFLSLPPGLIFIGKTRRPLLAQSPVWGSTLVSPSLAPKYQITVEVANTLAYYDKATITAIKSFIVQAPRPGTVGLANLQYSNTLSFVCHYKLCKKRFDVQNKLNFLLKIFLENA